jgi:hypothetical protein
LTGYAPHNADDTEVTAADLLNYVWYNVPKSAYIEYQQPQHLNSLISINFPVALLVDGKGGPPGKSLPDPLAPLPAAEKPASHSAFYQPGQTVHESLTNISRNVNGPAFSGNIGNPAQFESGRQTQIDHISDNSITVGNITRSTGVAIGHYYRPRWVRNLVGSGTLCALLIG